MTTSLPSTPGAVVDGGGVLVLRNAGSGAAVLRADPGPILRSRLPRAVIREIEPGEDLAAVVGSAMESDAPPSVLGVYGGDGSVSAVAALARKHARPLLVLPGGTFNHFARWVGIGDVGTALDALESGTTIGAAAIEVSADGASPVLALNAVSVGAYPEFLDERERRSPHLGKWLAGLVAGWRTIRAAEPLDVVRAGRRARVWSVFVSVGESDPHRIATMQRGSDDDVLDVRVHHARGSRVRATAALAFGRRTSAVLRTVGLMPPRSDLERFLSSDLELTVRPGRAPSLFVHDGEIAAQPANGFVLRCVVVPRAVTVYAPPR